MQILFCLFAKKLIAHPHPSFSTQNHPVHDQPLDASYENDTERQCQMYTANKHENPKIVQRDAGEVRDEVSAKKGPKRLRRIAAFWTPQSRRFRYSHRRRLDPGGRGVRLRPSVIHHLRPGLRRTPVTDSLLAGSYCNWTVGELEVFALEASG